MESIDTGLACPTIGWSPLDEPNSLSHCLLQPHHGEGQFKKQLLPTGKDPLAEFIRKWDERQTSLEDLRFQTTIAQGPCGKTWLVFEGESATKLCQNFYYDFSMKGELNGADFELHCPQIYVYGKFKTVSGSSVAVAHPLNKSATITYRTDQAAARVRASILNFDLDKAPESAAHPDGADTVIVVQAEGREVTFSRRSGYAILKSRLEVKAIQWASLLEFAFAAWNGATHDDLAQFAYDVAGLCSVVARQHTGVPLISFFDDDGNPIRHVLANPIKSRYRNPYAIRFPQLRGGLQQLFSQCFREYRTIDRNPLWHRLFSHDASIEDSTYIEQRCATLMAGLELLFRSSLQEGTPLSAKELEGKFLPELIGAARGMLKWDIPKHYTEKDRVRLLRNAVMHGGPLPEAPAAVRHALDKWSLFLVRRILIRLGFDGNVASPHKGYQSESPVSDFSEEHNSFLPDE